MAKTYRVALRYLIIVEVEAESEAEAIDQAHQDAFMSDDIETIDETIEELKD